MKRAKDKARKTMAQLKNARKVEPKGGNATASPTKTTMGSGLNTMMGTSGAAFEEGSPVDIILFGFNKKSSGMNTSFGNTASSIGSSQGDSHAVAALRHIIKVIPFTTFNIATTGADGQRIYTMENVKTYGGISKMPIEAQKQTQIQVLLDQRKPPTEELQSLCALYDDDLNPIH